MKKPPAKLSAGSAKPVRWMRVGAAVVALSIVMISSAANEIAAISGQRFQPKLDLCQVTGGSTGTRSCVEKAHGPLTVVVSEEDPVGHIISCGPSFSPTPSGPTLSPVVP